LFATIFVLLVVFLLTGLPIAFVLGMLGAGIIFFTEGLQLTLIQLPEVSYNAIDKFTLVAIPCFILTGEVLLKSGMGKYMYNAADKWLRHFPGGLAVATVVLCAFFAAIAGSSVATAMTIGTLAAKEMIDKGYPKDMAYGVIAAAGTIGILIPPSAAMILYGAITETSVLRLFTAGIIPGILLTLMFIVYIMIKTRKTIGRQPPATWSERWISARKASWIVLVPIVIFGGMYSGVFTPSEAAAVSVLVSLAVGMVIYKGMTIKSALQVIMEAASSSAMILYIIVGGLLFGHALTLINLPTVINEYVASLDMSPIVIILLINLLFIILGMFLEVLSIMLITVPIIFPIIISFGMDPVWLGIMMVINLELALITPPVGVNLYVMKSLADRQKMNVTILQIARAAVPYAVLMVLELVLIVFWPEIVMWLPNLVN
jgi:C4-dicarboxylate transporter DctM subunit